MRRFTIVIFLVGMLCSPSWARYNQSAATATNLTFLIGVYSALALCGHWRWAFGLAALTLNPWVVTKL